MFKIADKEWPDYFASYRTYIKNTHSYTNTRLSSNNALTVPKCRSNAGLRTFYASATRLWNRVHDNELKPWQAMTNESNSKKHLLKRLNINASGKHLFFYLDCTVPRGTRTPRPSQYLTHAQSHITRAVAVMDSCFALIGAHQHCMA